MRHVVRVSLSLPPDYVVVNYHARRLPGVHRRHQRLQAVKNSGKGLQKDCSLWLKRICKHPPPEETYAIDHIPLSCCTMHLLPLNIASSVP